MVLNYKKNSLPINIIPIEDVKISALGRNRKVSVTYDQLRRMEFCLKDSTTKRKKKAEFIQRCHSTYLPTYSQQTGEYL